jgi:hypothetical protein
MKAIVVRGANGVAVFTRVQFTLTRGVWQCSRDQFQQDVPSIPSDVVAFLQGVATHAQSHVGAISQVVELEV